MNAKIRILFKDRFIFYSLVLTIVSFAIVSTLVGFSYKNLPPLVPFFNSMPWGITRLYSADIIGILVLSLLGLVLLNLIITISVYRKFTLLARLLTFNSFLLCFLGLLAYIQILVLIN